MRKAEKLSKQYHGGDAIQAAYQEKWGQKERNVALWKAHRLKHKVLSFICSQKSPSVKGNGQKLTSSLPTLVFCTPGQPWAVCRGKGRKGECTEVFRSDLSFPLPENPSSFFPLSLSPHISAAATRSGILALCSQSVIYGARFSS